MTASSAQYPFIVPIRVRYHECDSLGVVFNANYVTYFDLAIVELWREVFGSYSMLADRHLGLAVADLHIKFLRAITFDDLIDVVVRLEALRTTSLAFALELKRGGEVAAEGTIVYVTMNVGDGIPVAVPPDIRTGLAGSAAR